MSFIYLFESDSLTREQLRKYNVNELQDILIQFNMESSGKKQELVERVFQFWSEIQSPSRKQNNLNQQFTSCIKMQMPEIKSIVEFRSKLENFGEISLLLLDSEFNSCYVSYADAASS